MFVIEVIPLSRSVPEGTLTYRSRNALPPGTIVAVPLRKRTVEALVVESASVLEAKARVKRAPFMLRGAGLAERGTLPDDMIEAARYVAIEEAASVGSVLGALVAGALPDTLPRTYARGTGFEEVRVERPYATRIGAYRALGVSGALLVVVPTVVEAKRIARDMGASLVLTAELRGARRKKALAEARDATGVIVATPAFAWTPVARLRAIAIERAGGSGYRSPKRPYLDTVAAARALAKARRIPIAYGDVVLPLTLREDPAAAIKDPPRSSIEIVSARGEDATERMERPAFRAVAPPIMEAVRAAVGGGGRAALLAARRGYAPAVVCRDCGNVLRDERGYALTLTISGARRELRSASGETKLDADAVCNVCGSWNLLPLGIGVERVEEEVRAALPAHAVVRIDATQLAGKRTAAEALDALAKPGTVVVGTEALLPYLDPATPLTFAGIASADTLLALPFWKARERLVRMGLTLRERAESVAVATRLPDDSAFAAIAHPDRATFFEEESAVRRALSYPPFGHLLTFHAEGGKAPLDAAARALQAALAPHPVVRLADWPLPKGRFRLSVVAKFENAEWPDPAIAARIAALPPAIAVHVDAESLW